MSKIYSFDEELYSRPDPRSTIKVNLVVYHRNGVSGEPFYRIEFEYQEPNKEVEALTCIIFSNRYKCCAIFNYKDPESKWRGDRFESLFNRVVEDYQIENKSK